MKKITASISADMDLLAKFDAAADQYRLSRSAVIKDCMEAYLELCQSANGRRLPGLEFKGFEQDAVKDPVLEINPQFRVFVNDFQYFRACVTGWLSQIPTLLMEMCDYVLSPAKIQDINVPLSVHGAIALYAAHIETKLFIGLFKRYRRSV